MHKLTLNISDDMADLLTLRQQVLTTHNDAAKTDFQRLGIEAAITQEAARAVFAAWACRLKKTTQQRQQRGRNHD